MDPDRYGVVDEKGGSVHVPVKSAVKRARDAGLLRSADREQRQSVPSDASSGRKPWGGMR